MDTVYFMVLGGKLNLQQYKTYIDLYIIKSTITITIKFIK